MIHFSVILPNLHTPTVGQTVELLERPVHAPYQVIVVGKDKYNLIREIDWVHFDHADVPFPPAKARNRGAAQAQGEVIAFTAAIALLDPTSCLCWPNGLQTLQ